VTLEDTTALVAAERAAAWEEAARRMAHEIKNPLTPIRLAAERMRRRAAAAPDAGDGLLARRRGGRLDDRPGGHSLAALVDTFQRFARLPGAVLEPTDLGAVAVQVAKLYDGVKRGIAVTADAPDGLPAREGGRGPAPPRAHQPRRQRGRGVARRRLACASPRACGTGAPS
jgi:two-component system nitrogen regulation sensor histidine kinase NtrY